MSAMRNGWQAERFVTDLLTALPHIELVVQLGPAFPADLLTLSPSKSPEFWEVKSSRSRQRASKSRYRLSTPEIAFSEWCLEMDYPYHVVQVWTKPDGSCVLVPPYPLSISPNPESP